MIWLSLYDVNADLVGGACNDAYLGDSKIAIAVKM